MGVGGGSNETGRDVAIGVGVDAVKNVIEDEVSSGVDNGKELVEEAVGKEIKRRQNHVRVNVNEYWVEHVLLGFMNMSLMNPSPVVGRRGRKGKVGKVINWLLIHRYVFFSSPIFRSYLVLLTLVQNCIHCKLCDIKVPTQDINSSGRRGWTQVQ